MHSQQLVVARQLECDISPRVCSSASSRVTALLSPSSELSAASSAAAQGSGASTKMSAVGAAFLWNHGTCLREVALAVAGEFCCEASCRSFQRLCAPGALGARRLSATEMASACAVVWLQRRQREHRAAVPKEPRSAAAAAASIAAEMTPSPSCEGWEEAASFSSSKQLSCSPCSLALRSP